MKEASRLFGFAMMQEESIVLVVGSEEEREEVELALTELKGSSRRLFAVEIEEKEKEGELFPLGFELKSSSSYYDNPSRSGRTS